MSGARSPDLQRPASRMLGTDAWCKLAVTEDRLAAASPDAWVLMGRTEGLFFTTRRRNTPGRWFSTRRRRKSVCAAALTASLLQLPGWTGAVTVVGTEPDG
jgi:hypothetical protein